MTANDFRSIALGLPDAIEASHMDHPDFRADGRIFASLGVPDDEWGMVKLTPEQQADVTRESPGVFRPCSGMWGERGATHIHLPSSNKKLAQAVLQLARQNVADAASKKSKQPTRPSAGKQSAKKRSK